MSSFLSILMIKVNVSVNVPGNFWANQNISLDT